MLRPTELETNQPYRGRSYSGAEVWAILQAADRGDRASMGALLGRHRDLCRATYGYTQPLHLAVRAGHVEVVDLLLEAGADPSSVPLDGEDLVATAHERGYGDVAERLEGARDGAGHVVPKADHPIHRAADRDDAEAVRSLLVRDAALSRARDARGGTPLHRAVAAAAHTVIGVLLAQGADPEARHGNAPGSEAGYAPAPPCWSIAAPISVPATTTTARPRSPGRRATVCSTWSSG